MVSTRKKGLLAVVAVMAALLVGLFAFAQVAQAASPLGDATDMQVGYRHNGGHDYEVEEPMGSGTWNRVYCLDPAKAYDDSARKNMDTRWRANLKNNAWLLNNVENGMNNKDSGVNGSHKPTADHINRLVSILWHAQQMNASIDDTQNAVWYFATQGSDDNYAGNVSKYNNYVVKAAGDSGWAIPGSYELYLYVGDTESNYNEWWTTQPMVRFVTDAQPENPPTPPEPPAWEVSTNVSVNGNYSTAEEPYTIILEPGQTEASGLEILDKIIYSNMEPGHEIWTMTKLNKLNDDGTSEFISFRSIGTGGDPDYMPEGEEYWIKYSWDGSTSEESTRVSDSGAGEWAFLNSTGMWRTLGPGTYYIDMSIYDAATGVSKDIEGKGDNKETFIIKPQEEPKYDVEISKVDATDATKELEGAKLVIKDKDGNEVDSWTSGTEVHKVKLAAGEYTLTETTAPDGYEVAETIEFTVTDKGLVGSDKVVMKDEPKKDETSKTEPTVKTSASPKEIEAAANQKVVDTVTLDGLKAGVKYTVTGTLVDADGNKVADADAPVEFTAEGATSEQKVTFTVDASKMANGDKLVVFESLSWEGDEHSVDSPVKHEELDDADQTVTVKKDEPEEPDTPTPVKTGHEVTINKTDMDGEEVDGAVIVIKDADGNEVDRWTSEKGKTKTITVKSGDYILTETTAPNGYQQVTTEISFTVASDGTVTVNTTSVEPVGACEVVDGVLVLKDAIEETPEPEPTPGEIATTVSANGVSGSATQPIKFNNGGTVPVVDTISYSNMQAGATYKVTGTLMQVKKDVATAVDGGTVTQDCVADAASGTWSMDFGYLTMENDAYYVVYETATLVKDADGNNVSDGETVEHANMKDLAQAIIVGNGTEEITFENPPTNFTPVFTPEIATTVSAGGKTATATTPVNLTATEAGKVTVVTDNVAFANVPAGTYMLVGDLMCSKDNFAEPVAEAMQKVTVTEDGASGNWTMTFENVQLAEDTKYVVFEYLVAADSPEALNEAIELGETVPVLAAHEDSSDVAQTIVVGKKTAAATKTPGSVAGKTTAKTSDDMGGAVISFAVIALLAAGAGVYARRKSMQR